MHTNDAKPGRPRATSADVIAEAACELFLEQGFESTSVSDIARRAGVSRSSFFNYFASKSEVLWAGLDQRIAQLHADLVAMTSRDVCAGDRTIVEASVAESSAAVLSALRGFEPDSLALAFLNSSTMGLAHELEREAAVRQARIGADISLHLQGRGIDPLAADVWAATYGGAVIAALRAWAVAGAGRTSLDEVLARALSFLALPNQGDAARVHLA